MFGVCWDVAAIKQMSITQARIVRQFYNAYNGRFGIVICPKRSEVLDPINFFLRYYQKKTLYWNQKNSKRARPTT